MGIPTNKWTRYNPQGNGQVERLNTQSDLTIEIPAEIVMTLVLNLLFMKLIFKKTLLYVALCVFAILSTYMVIVFILETCFSVIYYRAIVMDFESASCKLC